ncbi:MAG: site-specific integrase [Thermodesulfovibrionales bacterium]|nr:site-specific integrase [Thermodesulfovibrionales bacterium]
MQSQQEYPVDKQKAVSVKEVKKRECNPERHILTASSNGTYNKAEAIPQDLELISYLIDSSGEEKMKGAVRAKGTCPICEGKFQQILKIGFICPRCKTTPKKFYVDISYKGQRIRIFSDTTGQVLDTYQRALTLLSHINQELKNHSFDPSRYVQAELQGFYVQNLLDRFLKDKISSISPSRINHYTRYTDLAKEFFKTKDVREIRRIDISDYKRHLIEKYYPNQPKQGKTLKNVIDHFKTFLFYCKNEYEVIEVVPSFPDIEVQPYQFKWVCQHDQIKLFELVEAHDKPFIAFLMLHGCRPGEARALRCKDVDLKQQTVTISATFSDEVYKERRKGRGAQAVIVPIHPELYSYFEERIKNNLPEAYVFTKRNGQHYTKDDIRRLWDKVREKAAIGKDLRLYDVTRHSFASQLINANTSLYKVSRLLGHSSVKMTEKYAHHNITDLKIDIEKVSLKIEETVTKLSPGQSKHLK